MAKRHEQYQAISDAVVVDPRGLELEFNSYFHCWDLCQCRRDLPLCCYSCLCPSFLWAELMMHLDELPPCCCGEATWIKAYVCIVLTSGLEGLLQLGYQAAFPIASANSNCLCHITPLVSASSRRALGRKHGVSVNKDCVNPFCAHYWCACCAIYQEAIYVKHILRKDFTCCVYHCLRYLCAYCGQNPAPGEYCLERFPINSAAVSPVIDAQPNCLVDTDASITESHRLPRGLETDLEIVERASLDGAAGTSETAALDVTECAHVVPQTL